MASGRRWLTGTGPAPRHQSSSISGPCSVAGLRMHVFDWYKKILRHASIPFPQSRILQLIYQTWLLLWPCTSNIGELRIRSNGTMPSGEYLIEWIHRLAAAITDALVIATTVASYLNSRADAKIKVTRSLATAFVITDHAWRARNRPKTARGSGCNLFENRNTALCHGADDYAVCLLDIA